MMNHLLEKSIKWLREEQEFEEPVKRWRRLQAIGRTQYTLGEASGDSLRSFIWILSFMLLTGNRFPFRESFLDFNNLFLTGLVFCIFFNGWRKGANSWDAAERAYEDTIASQSADPPALAQASPSPISTQQGTIRTRINRP